MMAFFALPRGLIEWSRLVLAFVLGAALSAPLSYCEGKKAARAQADAARAEANVEAMKTNAAAAERAAEERAADAVTVTKQEEELIDAIQSTPDSAPDAVRVALGCQRLRAQGADPATLPAACGPRR
jgi:hypothetical protein